MCFRAKTQRRKVLTINTLRVLIVLLTQNYERSISKQVKYAVGHPQIKSCVTKYSSQ